MSSARRSTFIASIALAIAALAAPAAAQAAELPLASTITTAAPTIAELTARFTETAIAESRTANSLEWLDLRLESARERLATSASRRTREAIAEEIETLETERVALAADADNARREAEAAGSALTEAQAAEAARVRAEQVALYGVFPVAGTNEYIDSWGFARSGGRRHKGTDIMAAAGTPVVAVKDGTVSSGRSSLGGITLWLETADGTRYHYAHLESIEIGSGPVTAGQIIGYVGSTGNASASAPHLHFEIHRPDAVNPYPELQLMAR